MALPPFKYKSKPCVLLLVGEDHKRPEQFMSREGWLEVVKGLIPSSSPQLKVLRVHEESPKQAAERKKRGYSKVIGIEYETDASSAYKKILNQIITITHPARVASINGNNFRKDIIKALGCNSALMASKKILHMDIPDLVHFFSEEKKGNKVIENWFASLNLQKQEVVLQQFCKDQHLDLSYSNEEMKNFLAGNRRLKFYEQLFLVAIEATKGKGSANIRRYENPKWIQRIKQEVIKEMAISEGYDAVFVFVGKDHLDLYQGKDNSKYDMELLGLQELFDKDKTPFTEIFVANNVKDEMRAATTTTATSSSTSSEEEEEDIKTVEKNKTISTDSASDSEDDIDRRGEDKKIQQVLALLKPSSTFSLKM
jgi:hypothetical protein